MLNKGGISHFSCSSFHRWLCKNYNNLKTQDRKFGQAFMKMVKNADLWLQDTASAGSGAQMQSGTTIPFFQKVLRFLIYIFFNKSKQLVYFSINHLVELKQKLAWVIKTCDELQPTRLKPGKVISNRKEVLQWESQSNFIGRWCCSTQLYHVCANRYPQILWIHVIFYHYFSLLGQTVPQITVTVLFSFFFFFSCAKDFQTWLY